MNNSNTALAQATYGDTSQTVRSDRGTEYQAFARATNMLASSAADPGPLNQKCAEAVHFNRQLWGILAADVASDENQLPTALRAQILSIANFVWQQSSKALNDTKSIAPLIDVNKTIMRGLRDEAKV
jgi:flagellar protein FlaF